MKRKIEPQDVLYAVACVIGVSVIVMGILVYIARLVIAMVE